MRYFAFIITFCSILGCSTDNKEEPKGVIPEHQLKAMEDAKETGELAKKKLEEMDKKVQEASE